MNILNYKFTKNAIELAATATADAILKHLLRNEKVLLLLAGGSNVKMANIISEKLKYTNLSNLFVSITDERYGPIGHVNENWQQLVNAGLILPEATIYRPLTGQNLEQTTIAYNNWINTQFKKTDYKIGVFGIGTDGHTAGIKPNSSAVTAKDMVTSFIGEDFTRMTISFNAIKKLDEAIVQASGNDKRRVLHDLSCNVKSLNDQPAQILKSIPNATIYANINKEK